jgi:uncharacterized protein (TIGR03083 family)
MTITSTRVEDIRPIERPESIGIAETENRRFLDAIRALDAADWGKQTDCDLWDVRALTGHVVGMAKAFTGVRELARQMRISKKEAGDGPEIDALTALQVREHAELSADELVARYAEIGPRSARKRGRFPGIMRRQKIDETVGGIPEKWRIGYLLDVILTRDTWMHRVDVARATGREMVLTPDHDGRIVADAVAEWARRHGKAFTLVLTGPAGGTFMHGDGGEEITLDAVELCRTLSGRASGAGLLTQEVPF